MKPTRFSSLFPLLAALLLPPLAARAITFTGDTKIAFNDTSFDGLDIVVSNCTLTVDGPHSFASLQVLDRGIVTHTAAANGTLPPVIFTVVGEVHTLSSTNATMLTFSNAILSTVVVRDLSGAVVYTNGGDYQVTLMANGTAWLQLLPGSAIPDGSMDRVDYQYSGPIVPTGLTLTVSNNVLVQRGGSINVDGKGYGGGQGPGKGSSVGSPISGGGGGHGGNGGYGAGLDGIGAVYDSLQQPTDKGSGGGGSINSGGTGGGAIKLVVGGAVLVDGVLSANGSDAATNRSGGGAGGGIWLNAQTLAGSGTISANGGSGELPYGGGGGGGRIALQTSVNVFLGQTSAWGGNGYTYGGAGTIYSRTGSQAAQVLIDNGGHAGRTTMPQSAGGYDLTAQGGAVLATSGGLTLGKLLIRSNAWLSVSNPISLQFTVTGNAIIEEGGGITADSAGSPANQGRAPGRSSSYPVVSGGGGGYGGNGASGAGTTAFGGGSYGSLVTPSESGSGGGTDLYVGLGSAGGGAIRLQVAGTLVVNGRISADGGAGVTDGSGGGSGGSIWLDVGTLAGGGVISANGGAGNGLGLYAGGGGGGGRISIQSGMNLFFGMLAARGGGNYARGGAGTVYTSARTPSPLGQLVVDNGGLAGTNTPLTGLASPGMDLIVRGAAVVTFPIQPYIHNLLIGSNSWLVVSNQTLLTLNAAGDVTIQAGGGIVADGSGYAANIGPGAGRYSPLIGGGYTAGGGGYGGYGGDGAGSSTSTSHTGGGTYGSLTTPTERGSGGGSFGSSSYPAGAGGGALRLIVTRTLDVDGTITANGNSATTPGGGGGSGGGLWLTAGTFSGVGTIAANGGGGNGVGGGGGGGRIAIEYATNIFSGILAARGGNGNNRGGAGTIYTKGNYQSLGQVVIDNGGQPGTNTSWSQSSTVDLTITGGAMVTPPGSQTFGNLLIGPNSALLVSNQVLTVAGSATIQTGGAILADGTGYGPGQGPGAGRYASDRSGSTSGGGGYGGNGASGASAFGVLPTALGSGGTTYGSLTTPTDRGSGGGGSSADGLGGPGGGAVRLDVRGALTVAGRISANGASGAAGGGGSGGSVWLTAGTLSGSGLISANGGDGGGRSGGGGGGRIAITSSVNAFNGMISAFGGGGYAWGGAGTIYTASSAPSYQRPPQVIVDNGGNLGTNTTWTSQVVLDLIIRGGGVAAPPSGQAINNVLIASNSWMLLTNQALTILSNVTVQAGGGIVADGTGAGAQGPGAGRFTNVVGYGYIGGGGGYGGYGASAGFGSLSTGGGTYGSLTTPTDRGSGGGSYSTVYGNPGGGAIRLTINGAMTLNGRLSAQGSPGGGPGAGGGSGGSIWLTVGALGGAGLISANGGDGNGLGGGGGGGRIALICVANSFMGPITAFGGAGGSGWGGAGTIYQAAKNQTSGQVLVDNGGRHGTNTLIASQAAPFDLTVRNGAGLFITSPSLLLSNLDIGPGGLLGLAPASTNLSLTVLRDALIESGGELALDGKGYAGMNGPGKGATLNAIGSGGGYGGKGGASSLQPGGPAYGSALQPTDPGSSGGFGYGAWTGGSEGGGALRLSVGRTLTVNGLLSANGNPGLQDNAGGGSGGSIWVSAAVLAGTGQVQADGGEGELYGGGGGGGGRIAVYSPANLFGGLVSASGGNGFARGDDGTVYYSATLPPLLAANQSPAGTVTYAVANVDLTFDTALNPYTALASDVVVTTPAGALPSSAVTVTATSAATVRLSFPPQTAEGAYSLTFGSQLQSLYGQPLSQVYTGGFAIAWPVIQGTVTDSQNAPVAGVLVQPDGGLPPTYTDPSGKYALKVLPSGNASIVPALNSLVFVPRSRSYATVAAPLELQDYLAVNSIAPAPSVQYQAASMVMSWQGIPGVTYQPLCSSNLVNWLPYGQPVIGTNGPAELALPYDEGPQMFFRLRASN